MGGYFLGIGFFSIHPNHPDHGNEGQGCDQATEQRQFFGNLRNQDDQDRGEKNLDQIPDHFRSIVPFPGLSQVNGLSGKGELDPGLIETGQDFQVNPLGKFHEIPISGGMIPINAFQIHG